MSEGHLHAFDVAVDAGFAEFVETAPRRLGLDINARADLAEEGILLDLLKQIQVDVFVPLPTLEGPWGKRRGTQTYS